jgi:hypothetical protein
VWTVPDTPGALERVLVAFAQFFTGADLDRLKRAVHRRPERLQQALSILAQKALMRQTDLFADQPFRRVTFLTALDEQLGTSVITRCCLDDHGMPPPVDEVVESHHSAGAERDVPPVGMLKTFHQYCGACHHGTGGFPPNFLHGSSDQVEANLAQCAYRLFVRLTRWNVADREQPEAPMPPAMHLLHHRISPDQWKRHPDLQVLRKEVVAAIQRQRGAVFTPENLLQQDYDTLPTCLAPRRRLTEASGAHHG